MIKDLNLEFNNNTCDIKLKNILYVKLFEGNYIYIGATSDLQRRMRQHKSSISNNEKKYNEKLIELMSQGNHITKILYCTDSYDELMELEKQIIDEYRNDSNYNVINICDGGVGSKGYKLSDEEKIKRSEMYTGENNPFYNKHHSDETKQIISETNKGNKYRLGMHHTEETKEKLRQINIGKKHSDETKRKISEAGKGRKPSEKAIEKLIERSQKKVVQYNLNGVQLKIWDSITEAQNETGASNIYACCIGKQCKSGEYMWSYYGDNLLDNPKNIAFIEKNGKKGKQVLQYDKKGNFIKEWDNIKEAAESINGYAANISNVCAGRDKSYKNFVWKYKEDANEI